MKYKFITSIKKTALSQWKILPVIVATILLISLIFSIIPKNIYIDLLGNSNSFNLLFANIVGSISAGNPVMSYFIGGELLRQNINLLVVTVFIVSWVTVGIAQFPAESTILGKKFAIYRNIISFISSFVVAFLLMGILEIVNI